MTTGAINVEIDVADDVELADFQFTEHWQDLLGKLARTIYAHLSLQNDAECTIRFVSEAESKHLNKTYRDKDKPTNVLSFPADLPEFVESNFVGDIAICLSIIKTESEVQGKAFESHLIHIICHGILHLMGFDHITENEADIMETHEKSVLAELGIDDPYQVQ